MGVVVNMKRILLPLCLTMWWIASAQGAPSSLVAWTTETRALVESGDAERGALLVERDRCARCHGEEGVSDDPASPSLAGQLAPYTYKQMRDYKDEKRTDDRTMQRLAARLSDQEMADMAAYYAALPVPEPENTNMGGVVAERLVKRGDGPRLIPACRHCHGRSGKGNVTSGVGFASMPVLVGQYPEYLAHTMRAYRSGERANDVYSVMRNMSAELTDEEIDALADYYGTLGPD
jgi:cytochrome c553